MKVDDVLTTLIRGVARHELRDLISGGYATEEEILELCLAYVERKPSLSLEIMTQRVRGAVMAQARKEGKV